MLLVGKTYQRVLQNFESFNLYSTKELCNTNTRSVLNINGKYRGKIIIDMESRDYKR